MTRLDQPRQLNFPLDTDLKQRSLRRITPLWCQSFSIESFVMVTCSKVIVQHGAKIAFISEKGLEGSSPDKYLIIF
ncbi:hypothetical protein [uncultured Sphingobacterium sp.]|uniref:hypothetical protein n=1 Tax=uncultured Sphingobacterium sp. TaxID=182688 RepID=UPI00374A1F97